MVHLIPIPFEKDPEPALSEAKRWYARSHHSVSGAPKFPVLCKQAELEGTKLRGQAAQGTGHCYQAFSGQLDRIAGIAQSFGPAADSGTQCLLRPVIEWHIPH